MDNNLPSDPEDPNKNSTPPPFGSNFNPHSNPVDPNNPYQQSFNPPPPQNPNPNSSNPLNPPNIPGLPAVGSNPPDSHPDSSKHATYSEVAQHKVRDSHGRFVHSENSANPQSSSATPTSVFQTPPSNTPSSNPSTPNPSSFLPPIIEVNQNTEPSDKKDPPLFGFFLTNPVTYLKLFLKRLLKRQAVTLRIPVLVILIVIVGAGSYSAGLKTGIDYTLGKLFPNFSPILHRSISAQGTIQKSSKGYYLQANDKAKSLWMLKSTSDNLNLSDFVDLRVQIKGNLTPTPNLIEVSEVISFDTKADESSADADFSPASQITPAVSNTSTDSPTTPSTGLTNPNPANLPALYSNLKWEAPKNKTLTFTSGTRKIEQEVIYIESLQSNTYPQDFISYYTSQLTNSNFKQTLNSQEPNSTSITYSKGNLFLTFGVKNINSGSGESKQIVGYKGFIEHN